MNWFPFVWFPSVAGLGYLVYKYYILSAHHLSIWDNSLLNIYGVCSIYITHEILVRLKRVCCYAPSSIETVDDDVCCIVACHKAGLSLHNILPNLIKVFGAGNVYIADNGKTPDINTKQVCLDHDVNYRFYDIPNKTNALIQTAIHIEDTRECQYVVLLDDDTHIPETFFVRKDLLEQPLVAGYCCNITIHHPKNFWEKVIDFEYRSISYSNSMKSTIPFIHGIICVYHLRRMISIYSKLCTLPHGLPFGEDSFAGIDFRMAGYRLLHDDQNTVQTFCPQQLFSFGTRLQGFGASSIFKQRALRWYLSWIRRVPQELALMLCYDTGSWLSNITYRFQMVWYFFIMVIASSWLLFAIHVFLTHTWSQFGILHGILFCVNTLTAFIRYSGFNTHLKMGVSWYVPFFVPIMNIVVCCLMTFSFFMAILYYIPFVRIDYKKTYNLFQK
jgi:hypothetical protein